MSRWNLIFTAVTAVLVLLGVIAVLADLSPWGHIAMYLLLGLISVQVIRSQITLGAIQKRELEIVREQRATTRQSKHVTEQLVDLNAQQEQQLTLSSAVQKQLYQHQQDAHAVENARNKTLQTLTEATQKLATGKQVQDHAQRISHAIRQETRQHEALHDLYSQFRPRWMMPPVGMWALDARSVLHLVRLVEAHQPRHIVELGSGTSTVWLGYAAEHYGGQVTSFDHLDNYGEKTREYVRLHRLQDVVNVHHAPLAPLQLSDHEYTWYQLNESQIPEHIDMLVVDGPPAKTGAEARYPAMPALVNHVSPGGLVILDDIVRQEERDIVQRWIQEFPQFTQIHVDASGIAVLQRTEASTD